MAEFDTHIGQIVDVSKDNASAITCWTGVVGSVTATGAIGGSGAAGVGAGPGAVLGFLVGLLIASKTCRKGDLLREAINNKLTSQYSSSEFNAFARTLQTKYGVSKNDSLFLAKVSYIHNKRTNSCSLASPSYPEMMSGINHILGQKPV